MEIHHTYLRSLKVTLKTGPNPTSLFIFYFLKELKRVRVIWPVFNIIFKDTENTVWLTSMTDLEISSLVQEPFCWFIYFVFVYLGCCSSALSLLQPSGWLRRPLQCNISHSYLITRSRRCFLNGF